MRQLEGQNPIKAGAYSIHNELICNYRHMKRKKNQNVQASKRATRTTVHNHKAITSVKS